MDRLHQQTASWNLNAMDMNEILMTKFKGRIHILQNSNLFAHTLLSSSISDCQKLQKQTSDSLLEQPDQAAVLTEQVTRIPTNNKDHLY
jgi:hypothetical protein